MAEAEKGTDTGAKPGAEGELGVLYETLRTETRRLRLLKLLVPVVLVLIIVVYALIVYNMVQRFDKEEFRSELTKEALAMAPAVERALASAWESHGEEAVAAARAQYEERQPELREAFETQVEGLRDELQERLPEELTKYVQQRIEHQVQDLVAEIPELADEESRQEIVLQVTQVVGNAIADAMEQDVRACTDVIDRLVTAMNKESIRQEIEAHKQNADLEREMLLTLAEVLSQAEPVPAQ